MQPSAIVTTGKDDLDGEMLDAIVRRADENQALMDGTMEPVLSIMDAADIVVAIWQDMDQPRGIGLRVVKGHLLLQKENFTTTKWNSISCIEEAQAAALEKFYYTKRK